MASETGGTARNAALRRLREDRPDLHARVIAEELSPHAAMVEAGFRRKMASVPIEDIPGLARVLRRRLSDDDLDELRGLLSMDC